MVPWLPGLSIFINVYLMVRLDVMTWVRFGIWIAIGLLIYFSYGIRYSRQRKRESRLVLPETTESSESGLPLHNDYTEVPLIIMNNTS